MKMPRHLDTRSVQTWMLAALAVSAVGLGVLMIFTSGDVPRADEWNTPGDYLLARAKGTASLANLFRQHNESRVIFAQLLTAGLASFWGWNQHILHAINWALLALTAYIFIKMVVASLPSDPRLDRAALLILCFSVGLIFTPVQWRNFLSSGQIITIVIPCLLGGGLLVNSKEHLPIWVRYSCAAVFAIVASFSFVNGMLLWFLLWPLPASLLRRASVLPKRSDVLASILYFAAALSVIALFFADYHTPPGHPPLSSGLLAPHRTVFFGLTWLAGPLFPEHVHLWVGERNFIPFFLCGALAGLSGLLAALYLARTARAFVSRDLMVRIYPFVVLLTYSLVSATSIAMARSRLGIFGNMSRYSTVAVPAYLGLAGIVANLSVSKAEGRSRSILSAMAGVFGLAVVVAAGTGVFSCFLDKRESMQAKLSLAFRTIAPKDPLLTNVFPSRQYVSQMADELEGVAILKPSTDYSWVVTTTPVPNNDVGYQLEVGDVNGMRALRGKITPGNLEPDDVVVVWDNQSATSVTAVLAPAGLNYPGKAEGAFEVKFDPTAGGDLNVANYQLRLARPRTHEVWKLRALGGS